MTRGVEDVEHTKVAVRSLIVDPLGLYHNVVNIATVAGPTYVREQLGASVLGGFHLSKGVPSKLLKCNDLIAKGHLAPLVAEPTVLRRQE
jgi:hypothetical protein